MRTLLPAGMTLNEASNGFKNQGQFIAALHVSQNHGIPFADLKQAMTGIRPVTTLPGSTLPGSSLPPPTTTATTSVTTSTEPVQLLSLGQAIKKLRNGVDPDAAAATATSQANADLAVTPTATTATATTATTTTTTAPVTKKKNGK